MSRILSRLIPKVAHLRSDAISGWAALASTADECDLQHIVLKLHEGITLHAAAGLDVKQTCSKAVEVTQFRWGVT